MQHTCMRHSACVPPWGDQHQGGINFSAGDGHLHRLNPAMAYVRNDRVQPVQRLPVVFPLVAIEWGNPIIMYHPSSFLSPSPFPLPHLPPPPPDSFPSSLSPPLFHPSPPLICLLLAARPI